MSEDEDFVKLIKRYGAPHKLVWLTCGNTSNAALYEILLKNLRQALAMLNNGEVMVEIN